MQSTQKSQTTTCYRANTVMTRPLLLQCFDEWESALKWLKSASASPSPATAAARSDHLAALTTSSRDSDDETLGDI